MTKMLRRHCLPPPPVPRSAAAPPRPAARAAPRCARPRLAQRHRARLPAPRRHLGQQPRLDRLNRRRRGRRPRRGAAAWAAGRTRPAAAAAGPRGRPSAGGRPRRTTAARCTPRLRGGRGKGNQQVRGVATYSNDAKGSQPLRFFHVLRRGGDKNHPCHPCATPRVTAPHTLAALTRDDLLRVVLQLLPALESALAMEDAADVALQGAGAAAAAGLALRVWGPVPPRGKTV